MKQLAILALLVSVVVFGSIAADAASMSTAGPGNPLDVGETPINGFIDSGSVSSPTLVLNGTARLLGTVPAGATHVYIRADGGPVNVGNASVTTTISSTTPMITIASGSYLKLNLRRDDLTPNIYLINGTAGTSCNAVMLYGK